MPEPDSSRVLSYETPSPKRMENLSRPDSVLGLVSCLICALSVGAAFFLRVVMTVRMHAPEEAIGFLSAGSVLLCVLGGIPLALSGLTHPEHRKRLSVIGLVANSAWPLFACMGVCMAV